MGLHTFIGHYQLIELFKKGEGRGLLIPNGRMN